MLQRRCAGNKHCHACTEPLSPPLPSSPLPPPHPPFFSSLTPAAAPFFPTLLHLSPSFHSIPAVSFIFFPSSMLCCSCFFKSTPPRIGSTHVFCPLSYKRNVLVVFLVVFFKGKSTSSYISTAFTEVDKARGNDKLLCFILPVLFNLYFQFSAFQFQVDERFGCAVDTEACPLAGRCVRWWQCHRGMVDLQGSTLVQWRCHFISVHCGTETYSSTAEL